MAGDESTGASSSEPAAALTGLSQPSDELQSWQLASPMFNLHPSQQGIGGWLVLVAIGLVVSPFLLMRYVWLDFQSLSWPSRALIAERVPGLLTLIGLELFCNIALVAGLILLIVLFFREHRLFPRSYQFWLAFALVARLAAYSLSFRLGEGSTWEGAHQVVTNLHARLGLGVLQSLATAIVWISYIALSDRVKATFVR